MSKLEQIVRPSTAAGIRPLNFTVPRKPAKQPKDNLITWGNSGDDIFTLTAHMQQDIKNDLKSDETKRTYDEVRVFDPNDHDNFVDQQVMTEYQGRNTIDKSRIFIRFAKNEPSADIEVRKRGVTKKTGE
jgi:hypothetical protein